MTNVEVLLDGFSRIPGVVAAAVDGLTPEQLTFRVDGEANTIAWLVWHLTRIQDDHLAHVAGMEQVWISGGWFERFGLPFDPEATGYGHRPDDVAACRVESWELLEEYFAAVHAQTIRYVEGLTDADLDRIVDDSWDPPVTLGVRLVSVISDDLQHAGQAAFIRGIVRRT
jgi:uncharacterized damage-inducible protein DinB